MMAWLRSGKPAQNYSLNWISQNWADHNRTLMHGAIKLQFILIILKISLHITLRHSSMVKLEPMKVKIELNNVPLVCRPWKYPARAQNFMGRGENWILNIGFGNGRTVVQLITPPRKPNNPLLPYFGFPRTMKLSMNWTSLYHNWYHISTPRS